MEKKKVEEDKTINMINEIRGILDDNYFHICVSFNKKFRNNIEWAVYYKNLNQDDYFSNKNKPLLSSSKNTIADIYILKDIFDKQQQKEKEDFGLFMDNMKIHTLVREVKERASLGMINIFTVYVLVCMIINSIANKVVSSFLGLLVCILISIYFLHTNKKLNKLVDTVQKVNEKVLLKNLIKGKGIVFLNELKKELREKGVYTYAINKETRKATK